MIDSQALYPEEIIQLQKGEVLVVRPIEPQPPKNTNSWIERNMYFNFWEADGSGKDWPGTEGAIRAPFGQVGSEFWVQEAPRYRIRFKCNPDDYRPIKWPVKHPYWCSGFSETHSIVISYAGDEAYIYEHWPEASDLEIQERNSYTFTDRFEEPEWLLAGQKELSRYTATHEGTTVEKRDGKWMWVGKLKLKG